MKMPSTLSTRSYLKIQSKISPTVSNWFLPPNIFSLIPCFILLQLILMFSPDYSLSGASTYYRTKFRFHRMAIKVLAFIAQLPLQCHLIQHHVKQENWPSESCPIGNSEIMSIMQWLWVQAMKSGVVGVQK